MLAPGMVLGGRCKTPPSASLWMERDPEAEDVRRGALRARPAGGAAGQDEPAGGGSTVWDRPRDGGEDSEALEPARIHARHAGAPAEAGRPRELHRAGPGRGRGGPSQAAPYGSAQIFERLRDERGRDGGHSAVRAHLRPPRLARKEAFIPPTHPPGHAQADFGEAVAVLGGVEQKIRFLVMAPRFRGGRLCPRATRSSRRRITQRRRRRVSRRAPLGLRLLRRRAAVDPVRRHHARRGPVPGRRDPQARATLFAAPHPPPLRGPLWPSGEGERRGPRRGDGQLRPPELSGSDPAGARRRRAERAPAGALSGAPAGRAAGREGFRLPTAWPRIRPPSSIRPPRSSTPATSARVGPRARRSYATRTTTTQSRSPTRTAR